MPKLIRILFYILAILLPIQTLLVQFSTNKLSLPQSLALWKEGVVGIIILYFIFDISKDIWRKYRAKNHSNFSLFLIKNTWLLLTFILLNVVIIFNSFILNSIDKTIFLYGYRFEIFWLLFFVISVTWFNFKREKQHNEEYHKINNNFLKNLSLSILTGFIISGFITLLSLILGQNKVLAFFGYGDTIQNQGTLITGASLCNVIDYGSDSCRLSGTFSTPNHFAGYLLLVLPIFLVIFIEHLSIWYKFHFKDKKPYSLLKGNPLNILLITGTGFTLSVLFVLLTASRNAWLSLLVFFGLILIYLGYRFKIFKLFTSKILFAVLLLIPASIGILAINLNPEQTSKYLPQAIAKPSSTIEHYRHTMASIEVLTTSQKYFTGFGLGSSGSVAKDQYQDLSKNQIYTQYGYISYKWGMLGPNITIPENWFLAVLLNGGFIYLILYLIIVFYPLSSIYKFFREKEFTIFTFKKLLVSLGFFSIIIGNLFLHIWENQTITIYWSLLFIWWELKKIEKE